MLSHLCEMGTVDGLGSKTQANGAAIILNTAGQHGQGQKTALKAITSAIRHSTL